MLRSNQTRPGVSAIFAEHGRCAPFARLAIACPRDRLENVLASPRLRRIAVTGALAALTACVAVPGSVAPPQPLDTDAPRLPDKPREDCTRHILAAHAALATIADSVMVAAPAHATAMHDYHMCITRTPLER
jgi:hypothetical protein